MAATCATFDELAHVPGPVVRPEAPLDPALDDGRRLRLACALADLLDEQRQVVDSLTKGGELDTELRDPKEEVAAEPTGVHLDAEIAARRGEDAHVDRLERVAAHALHLALGQHTEELRLELDGELAELVEEERAAVRLGAGALLALGRAGEQPFS